MLLSSERAGRVGTCLSLHIEPLPPLPALAEEWRTLEREADASPFLGWTWIGTWLASLPPHLSPLLLRVREGDALAGLAILVRHAARRRLLVASRQLVLNAAGDPRLDGIAVEHNGVLALPGMADLVLDCLVQKFLDDPGLGDELCLPGMIRRPEGELLARAGALRHGIAVPCFAVDLTRLAGTAGDLTALLSRNARQQLRRALRRFASEGELTVTAARSTGEALDFFQCMKALHVASWQRRGSAHAFSTPFFERFHAAFIAAAFPEGGVQLLRIAAGARPIGYLYNLCRGDRIYAYQSGFADDDARTHPGYVSHLLAIRHNVEQGARLYDFLAGRNRLKETLSTDQGEMHWDRIQRPLLRFRAEAAARNLRRRLAALRPVRG
jgi:CelD/BcsL family acetyltransferase involved in cellulose biosynthesis